MQCKMGLRILGRQPLKMDNVSNRDIFLICDWRIRKIIKIRMMVLEWKEDEDLDDKDEEEEHEKD